MSALALARAALKAYADKDRAAIEALVGDGFHFTSPLDNRLDRATYMQRCWPNSQHIDGFEERVASETGDTAIIVYEARAGGHRFCNCEVYRARDGKLVSVEVYFGWDLPHRAPEGGFIDG